MRAVRAARADVWLGVDANQGLNRRTLEALLPALVEARVALIEQPVPLGQDASLDGLENRRSTWRPTRACSSLADLPGLVGRYDVVNIKLDKCGGLTEGLAMAREARRLGLKVMVGCMSGASLAIAPAFVLGLCDLVDLDGPIFLAEDRKPAAAYADGDIWCPDALWGGAA